jgi:hypothetical protein
MNSCNFWAHACHSTCRWVDPTSAGPADTDALRIFAALNSLGIITVRPLLLAIGDLSDPKEGMEFVLKTVVRRIVIGNLGTGNVERRLSEAAKKVHDAKDWRLLTKELSDRNPTRQEFEAQIRKRSYNKGTLTFLRRSIIFDNIAPEAVGTLHFIWPRVGVGGQGFTEDEGAYWGATIGNTFLATLSSRPMAAATWDGFKEEMLPHGVDGEWTSKLQAFPDLNAGAVEAIGNELAKAAAKVWFR